MNQFFNVIGTMSGTSFDGVDISLAKTNGDDHFEILYNLYEPFNKDAQDNLKLLKSKINKADDIEDLKNTSLYSTVNGQVTNLHTKLIKQAILKSKDQINLIGFHGITLYHNAKDRFTFQIGDIDKIYKELKIPLVYNFRQNDLDHGGQGAPLTPIFHQFILNQLKNKQTHFDGIVNIGGISNISYFQYKKLYATDIGPGNCLIDSWCKEYFNVDFDQDGLLSASSKPDLIIANNFIDRFTFNRNISYDFNDFSISEFRNLEKDMGITTLSFITANLIITFLNEKKLNKVLVSGGGRKNKSIMNYLGDRAVNIDEVDFDGDFTESQAFAYLAARSQNNLPLTFPETTGVEKPVTGGVIKKV